MRKGLPKVPKYATRWMLLDLLGIVAGIVGGLGAVVFRMMISLNHHIFFKMLLPHISLNVGDYNLGMIVLPALGGLIIGPIIMKFAPETKGHGIPEVLEAVTLKGGKVRKRVAFIKVIVSSITIGSGGSAGREGPIAQIGATIGSVLGQILKLSSREIRLLVVCGLSAGIAGTFNAPLGGALFGMEILLRGVGLFNAIPIMLASAIGATVASTFLGQRPSFIAEGLGYWSPPELMLYILLGIVFGILAFTWVRLFYTVEEGFSRMKIPPSYKLAIGGLFTGVLIMLYPEHGISGVGYEGINMCLRGELPLMLLITLGFVKMLATSCTIGSGGSGGVFAPSLYIGSMFGGAMGLMYHYAFPEMVKHPFTYSLAGMGALFAGAAQAPLNVIIMIPEMSKDYTLIAPLMASSVTSYFVAWLLLKGSSIYTIKLEKRGIRLRMGRSFTLDLARIEEVMSRNVIKVSANMPVSALELLFREHHYGGYPVIEGDKLIGMVTANDLKKVPEGSKKDIKAKDIASKKLIVAYPDETVHEALDKMYRNDIGRLPVIDRKTGKLVGIITRSDIIKAYEIVAHRPYAEEAAAP